MQDSPTSVKWSHSASFTLLGGNLQLALGGVMKRIQIRIKSESEQLIIKSLEKLLCDESIKSVSEGLRVLLKRLEGNNLSFDNDNDVSKHNDNAGLEQVSVYLNKENLMLLKKASVKHRWSLSREVRFRLAHTLNDDFDVYDNELREFHISRNAIDKVGRNIRFIIAHNQNMILDKNEFSNDIREVISLTMGLRDRFDHYIKLCGNRKVSNKFRSYDAAEN